MFCESSGMGERAEEADSSIDTERAIAKESSKIQERAMM